MTDGEGSETPPKDPLVPLKIEVPKKAPLAEIKGDIDTKRVIEGHLKGQAQKGETKKGSPWDTGKFEREPGAESPEAVVEESIKSAVDFMELSRQTKDPEEVRAYRQSANALAEAARFQYQRGMKKRGVEVKRDQAVKKIQEMIAGERQARVEEKIPGEQKVVPPTEPSV